MIRRLPTRLINLTEINKRYYHDLHRFICVAAGRRSRKDLIGVRKIIVDQGRGALNLQNQSYILAAPTRGQAKKIFWDMLKHQTKLITKKKYDGELKIILLNGSEISVVGLDKPERIEGITYPPIKGILITEYPNCKKEIWGDHVRPILSDNEGWAILNGVPEGMNHWHDKCLYAAGGILPKAKEGHGVYAENPDDPEWIYYSWFSADVLPVTEIDAAKRELEERVFRQEYEASFENEEGLAYYAFSEKNIQSNEYDPHINLDIGMDFNVNPMCSVEGHLRDGGYYQHNETKLINSNTYEMSRYLIQKYNLKICEDGYLPATVYPDATGAARGSNATMTDLQILKKAGFKIKARKSNPDQRDRINAVNSVMRPMIGEPLYFVDPSCKETIDDCSKVQRLADGRLNKAQEEAGKARVHMTDSLGYILSYNFPVRKKDTYMTSKGI